MMRPWQAIAIVFALLLALMLWLRTHVYLPFSQRIEARPPLAISGDEPHYLVAVHNLLFDPDRDVRRTYERARAGGPEAGRRFRRAGLDHHAILFDPATRRHLFWNSILSLPRQGWPSRQLEILEAAYPVERSSHPIGFPALIAALLAPTRPTPDQVEERMSLVILLLSWLGGVATYLVGRRGGMGRVPSLAAALLLMLASPWLVYSRSYFSETAAGLALLAALGATVSRRPIAAALAIGAAFVIKPPYILVGFAWIVERLWKHRWREAAGMTTVLAAVVLAMMLFDHHETGSWLVSGNGPWISVASWTGTFATLIDGRYGLLTFVPWVLLALPALTGFLVRDRGSARWTRAMALPLLSQLGLLMAHRPLGATCYGPRYWVPFLPWLALAAVEGARNFRWGRPALGVAAAAGALVAIPAALMYPLIWNTPPHAAFRAMLRSAGHVSRTAHHSERRGHSGAVIAASRSGLRTRWLESHASQAEISSRPSAPPMSSPFRRRVTAA